MYDAFLEGGVISCPWRKGYKIFDLKGVDNYLNEYEVGRFDGVAVAEPNNPYDEYAVAIFAYGVQIGYIPRRNKKIFNYIMNEGGRVHCLGYVALDEDGYLYGGVSVECNKNEVSCRNKPYIPRNNKLDVGIMHDKELDMPYFPKEFSKSLSKLKTKVHITIKK